MSDFEVHVRGTSDELRLSRRLADAVAHELPQWEHFPPSVARAYDELYNHYMKQIEMEQDK
jgi:hypothetical protein